MFEQRSSSDAFEALSIRTKTTRDNKRYTRGSGSDVNNCSPAPTSRFLALSLSHGDSGKRQLLRHRASLAGYTMTTTATATTTSTSTQANKKKHAKNDQFLITIFTRFLAHFRSAKFRTWTSCKAKGFLHQLSAQINNLNSI